MLYETTLNEAVGEEYCYSNFGYCLLGRVIETVTGMPYIRFIQESFNVDVRVAGDTS